MFPACLNCLPSPPASIAASSTTALPLPPPLPPDAVRTHPQHGRVPRVHLPRPRAHLGPPRRPLQQHARPRPRHPRGHAPLRLKRLPAQRTPSPLGRLRLPHPRDAPRPARRRRQHRPARRQRSQQAQGRQAECRAGRRRRRCVGLGSSIGPRGQETARRWQGCRRLGVWLREERSEIWRR
ncbi:hypothetical protein C346_00239 [Cryptococcus neoformans D17-1]|nr:hypothetical protein C346_00239 [Cryptococcus neoformans var. grubii D17-1]